MRRAPFAVLSALGLLTGCPKVERAMKPAYAGAPRAFKLLSETQRSDPPAQRRPDLVAAASEGAPIVVTSGAVGPFARHGATFKLYGDEAGKQGWSVEGFLLVEIVNAKGAVLDSVAIGVQQGIMRGTEQIDSMGEMKPAFGPGEIDLSNRLPPDEPVSIKATALDTGEPGSVSDLYVILSSDSTSGQDEEMQDK